MFINVFCLSSTMCWVLCQSDGNLCLHVFPYVLDSHLLNVPSNGRAGCGVWLYQFLIIRFSFLLLCVHLYALPKDLRRIYYDDDYSVTVANRAL